MALFLVQRLSRGHRRNGSNRVTVTSVVNPTAAQHSARRKAGSAAHCTDPCMMHAVADHTKQHVG